MGKQESPVELPPMYINHDEREAVTSLCARYGGYGGYTGWELAYRRERQLREALAQVRVANERAEALCIEHRATAELCAANARAYNAECGRNFNLSVENTRLKGKLAVPPVSPSSLLEDAADLIRQYEDKRAGRSKFFPDFSTVTQWLARYKEAK